MPKYQVDIPHDLPVADAKQRISGLTEKLTRDYGAACTWKGETALSVSRKGLDALVTVEPSRVHIDMNLGFLLTPFAEKIKSGIAKQLSNILTTPPGN
jgi:putative polyhydroxyalkanoate system protein